MKPTKSSGVVFGALLAGAFAALSAGGCADGPQEQRLNIIHASDKEAPRGGIPTDKQLEIESMFDEHNSSITKCYNDVLEEMHTRDFKGNVKLVVTIEPSGAASEVKRLGGSMTNQEVLTCLQDTIKRWEFPKLEHRGQVEKEFNFRPAY